MPVPANPTAASSWRALINTASRQERGALLWSFLFFFSQLFGYYILRSVREGLIAADGSRLIPTVFTSVFICMLLLTPLYGALVARFARRHFMPVIYLLVIAALVLFGLLLGQSMTARLAIGFAIFLSVINLFTDSVFWSFMADIFDSDQAKRFYGIIAAGGTAGAILGPLASRLLVGEVDISGLMLISAAFYALCLVCLMRLIPWARAQERDRGENGDVLIGGSIIAGAKLVWRKPLLLALVVHMFLGVSIGTLLYNAQADVVGQMALTSTSRTEYFATIDLAMNILVLLVQVSLTRFLMIRYGAGPLLMIPAALVAIGLGSLALAHGAMLLAMVQIGHRGLSFSMVKPARDSLYTLVDRESRYKAKNFIDTVVYRGGDMVTSWGYFALGGLGFSLSARAGVWAGIAVLWMIGALWLVRVQRGMRDRRVDHAPLAALSETIAAKPTY